MRVLVSVSSSKLLIYLVAEDTPKLAFQLHSVFYPGNNDIT